MWHIDGHHKLIRFGLLVHGGIDPYSHTVVYPRCSDDNRADTVVSAFEEAVQMHGLAYKSRSDLGRENVDIWQYIVEQQCDSFVVITGMS